MLVVGVGVGWLVMLLVFVLLLVLLLMLVMVVVFVVVVPFDMFVVRHPPRYTMIQQYVVCTLFVCCVECHHLYHNIQSEHIPHTLRIHTFGIDAYACISRSSGA